MPNGHTQTYASSYECVLCRSVAGLLNARGHARARELSLCLSQPSPDQDLGRSSVPRRRRLGTNSQNSVFQNTYYSRQWG